MWFLLDSVKQQIEKAMASGMQFSAEEKTGITTKSEGFGRMSLRGRAAIIPIEGILTKKPDFIAAFFGGGNTLYGNIISSIAQAEASEDVDNIDFIFNTPGGDFDELTPTMDAIKNATKPTRAIIANRALSAGYGLASQTNIIIASDRASMVGSVGTAIDTFQTDDEISISNTTSPKKRPDLKTPEGKAIVREFLDDVQEVFAGGIAEGRKVTVAKLNKDFGQGAIVLANDALESGMIDGIQSADTDTKTTAIKSGNNTEVRSMDLKQLKAEHPAVFDEAVEIGSKEERDRVCAHLKMGEASGDMKTALGAIEDGSSMTATLMATYQAAMLNKSSVTTRTADNQDGLDTPPAPDAKTADQKLDEEIAAKMGADEGEGVWL